ncbi:NAD(P)-binding domain-containing protein, partial [Mycobacteroides abscessus]|uniref:NAD(P)-binding domain-containing protein n=1 Tax=Mycobacteroides abscessus TaxID=36809 RepID=UPI003CE7CE04
DIETSRYCHAESARRGFRFVDAPVSGGISGAHPPGVSVYPGGTTPKWMEGLEPLPYMRRYADDE